MSKRRSEQKLSPFELSVAASALEREAENQLGELVLRDGISAAGSQRAERLRAVMVAAEDLHGQTVRG